jgi:hypothetical protein
MTMSPALAAILDQHCVRYPMFDAADVYKLVHQGVFGPGHIVASPEAARRTIEDEVRRQKSEGGMRSETVDAVEEIDPEGRFVRVNLRPLRGKPDLAGRLAVVLVESAASAAGEPAGMESRLRLATEWCRRALPGRAASLEELAHMAAQQGWPPVHHSDAYRQAYRPAYRVVRLDRFEASGLL